MSDALRQLADAQAARDGAKSALDDQLLQVRGDVAARSIPRRAADRSLAKAREGAVYAADIARENKLIVGLTAGAVLLWFARGPVIEFFHRHLTRRQPAPDLLEDEWGSSAETESRNDEQ